MGLRKILWDKKNRRIRFVVDDGSSPAAEYIVAESFIEHMLSFASASHLFIEKKIDGKVLSPGLSPEAAKILARVEELFRSSEAAVSWLTEPQIGLGGMVPLDMLQTKEGAGEVLSLLGRLEHGVIS